MFVNDEWLSFAHENGASHLTLDAVLNKSLWQFITDFDVQHLYTLIFNKVLADQLSVKIPFRCDSPDCRRFMEMEISPLSGNRVQIRNRILREEFREPVDLLNPAVNRSKELVRMCSWCKKIDVSPSNWVEVEQAVKQLNLFEAPTSPQLTHGICPTCYENVRKTELLR